MTKQVKAVPEGYSTVTSYLIVKGAAKAIEFYKQAFGAEEVFRMAQPDGKVCHAEIKIGDSRVMLADEFPEMGAKGPHAIGGTPVKMHLYVEDVDAVAEKAVAAGAKVMRPVQNQFYGDRSGCFQDPFGHEWSISSHVEDVSMEECEKRFKEMKK